MCTVLPSGLPEGTIGFVGTFKYMNPGSTTQEVGKSKFGGSSTTRSTSTTGTTTGGDSLGSTSQVSTPHSGGSSSIFRMEGHDPTIILPEFRGETTEDPEKHLFICAKI
jgi:hypothetical protein